MTDEEVLAQLEQAIEAEGGVAKFAARALIAQSYIYEVRRGTRKPGPAILAALGLERVKEVRPLQDGMV